MTLRGRKCQKAVYVEGMNVNFFLQIHLETHQSRRALRKKQTIVPNTLVVLGTCPNIGSSLLILINENRIWIHLTECL